MGLEALRTSLFAPGTLEMLTGVLDAPRGGSSIGTKDIWIITDSWDELAYASGCSCSTVVPDWHGHQLAQRGSKLLFCSPCLLTGRPTAHQTWMGSWGVQGVARSRRPRAWPRKGCCSGCAGPQDAGASPASCACWSPWNSPVLPHPPAGHAMRLSASLWQPCLTRSTVMT